MKDKDSIILTKRKRKLAVDPDSATDAPPNVRPPVSVTLGDFENEELQHALDAYRRRMHFTGELSESTEGLCHNPLLLRLVAQAWTGKDLPHNVNTRELWDAYWATMTGPDSKELGRLAIEIASSMRKSRTTSVAESRIANSKSYSRKRLASLVASGLIAARREAYDCRLSFAHERLTEYAFARSLMQAEGDVTDNIQAFLDEMEGFAPLEGALGLLRLRVLPNCIR